jgi:pyruvate dehydrogenase E2 component (dihydrolipoamide acetyltransferase)
MKELLYIGIQEGNAAPVDSLLAIIGPEGTDISGTDNYKAKGSDESTEPAKKLNQCQKKKK